MKLAKFTTLASALLFSVAAFAQTEAPKSSATLAEVDGSILVNSGEEFVAGVNGEVLMKGSRVMAMEGSTALLKYDDGCDVKVESGTVVTLSDGSPCAGWLLTVEAVAPGGLAIGAKGAVVAGVSPWVYVPAVVVAGVLIAEELDDDPSSP
ncbi:MAG: hypothetical protein ACT4NL_11750 [Pseudomarimonas sp.]